VDTWMVMRFCFRTLKFPPWQPSIARISEFINNHWSRVFSSSLQELTVFLKEPANDRSSSSFSGWFFASFQKHWELWVCTKTPGLWIFVNFCGYESILRNHLDITTAGLFLFLITIQHLVVTSVVEWVPEWNRGIYSRHRVY